MIIKATKKPVQIEAIQYDGNNCIEIIGWAKGHVTFFLESKILEIRTLEGTMRADIGDYIIKGIKGEFYPCKPDIFEASYDVVTTTE